MGVYFGIEEVGGVSQVEDVPVGALDDDELRSEAVEGYAEACDIARQIEDDAVERTRPQDWLGRAKSARRHILRRVDACRAELMARGAAEPLPSYAASLAAEALAVIERKRAQDESRARAVEAKARRREEEFQAAVRRREAKARREADTSAAGLHLAACVAWEKAEKVRAYLAMEEKLRKEKAGLFLSAASFVLTKEERVRIWAKAREMYPEHSAFVEREAQS